MGKKLIIKGADFSENALPIEDILIKQGYSDPISALVTSWRYDSVPADADVIIHKVEVVVPEANKLDKTKASSLWLAAYDGVNNENGLSNIVRIDMTDIVSDIVDNNKEASLVMLTLPTPLAVSAGKYFAFTSLNSLIDEDTTTNNPTICFKVDPDGTFGRLIRVSDNGQTSKAGSGINWYGIEV